MWSRRGWFCTAEGGGRLSSSWRVSIKHYRTIVSQYFNLDYFSKWVFSVVLVLAVGWSCNQENCVVRRIRKCYFNGAREYRSLMKWKLSLFIICNESNHMNMNQIRLYAAISFSAVFYTWWRSSYCIVQIYYRYHCLLPCNTQPCLKVLNTLSVLCELLTCTVLTDCTCLSQECFKQNKLKWIF